MKIVIDNIKAPIKHSIEDVFLAAQEIVRSDFVSARNLEIYKRSIDARRKNNIHYVYSVIADADKLPRIKNVRALDKKAEIEIPRRALSKRPVVIGLGPCGLFAAFVLALSGNPPIVLERGEAVEERKKSVEGFWKTGKLNPNSNVQFGEGGAGTFSDGKLTTRIGDPRQRFVLKTFVDFGAKKEIMYDAKPHIGTDKLSGIIKNMRNKLIEMGADIRFNSCVTDFKIKDNKISAVEVNGCQEIACDKVALAIGHSSRDTYTLLQSRGVEMEKKPFAIGVRIEHSQKFIDFMQYGEERGLPAADYRVVYNGKERSCYSFCMCPGGTVVNASSEEEMLAVNGMSNGARDGRNANSALVVTVNPSDFGKGVLGGMELQRKYEALAFKAGGGNGKAPVQLAEDFVKDRVSVQLKDVAPTVTSGYSLAEIKNCLPSFVCHTLKDGLNDFERKIKGFSTEGAILTGIESRTSAPVRINRGADLNSTNVYGLYPSGEGAGYAGGIVSAAVDGIRCALAMLD